MKNNYSFYSLLTAIPVGLLILLSFSSGQPGQFSGSPGDGNSTCTSCHAPGSTYGGVPTLTGVPSSYVPGQSYNLSLAINGSSRSKFGFNITAESGSNAKVGTWTAGAGTQLRSDAAGLTHTNAGNTSSTWNFTWVAPATNQGNVTFYFATIQANNAGGNSGDQTVAGSVRSTLGIDTAALAAFSMFPTQVDNDLNITLKNADAGQVRIYNLTGALVQEQAIAREERLSLVGLTTGMYLVNVTANGGTQTARIIKN
ncbi:MAG: T9SS type A sorting domain-containing protein [Nonlabens sp.]|nr:T9SS type A sorting domain-containing protein [Nonlabens sp.]